MIFYLYLYITLINQVMKNQSVSNFLDQMKAKCEAKAKQMNALELKHWDSNTERQLISDFKFTPKQVAERKANLMANC